jgi:universal stress protein E
VHNVYELHPRSVRFAERASGRDAIEKILVVVDPMATRHPCIEKAVRLASGFGSTIELFICATEQGVPESWAGGSTLAQYRGLIRERWIGILEELAAPVRALGVHVRTESAWHVSLEQGIVEHAIRTGADLVIKDTRRHAPTSHTPSVQTDWILIRQLPMALLLVHPTAWDAHPVIATSVDPCHVAERPVDLDRSLLAIGCSMSRALSGEVAVLHALSATPHLPGEHISSSQQSTDYDRQRSMVKGLAMDNQIDAGSLRFTERTIPDGIIELVHSTHPAVLVMGVAARQRLPTGSVSTASQVLERTDCDLLVVKPAGFVSPALVTG